MIQLSNDFKQDHLVRESRAEYSYDYYPWGEYVVVAPGVCGGRPTFKGTRLEVQVILDHMASGWSVDELVQEYHRSGLTKEAISEAVRLAAEALTSKAEAIAA